MLRNNLIKMTIDFIISVDKLSVASYNRKKQFNRKRPQALVNIGKDSQIPATKNLQFKIDSNGLQKSYQRSVFHCFIQRCKDYEFCLNRALKMTIIY